MHVLLLLVYLDIAILSEWRTYSKQIFRESSWLLSGIQNYVIPKDSTGLQLTSDKHFKCKQHLSCTMIS